MTKRLIICPHCDDSRAFTWQGAVLHVKAKHPDKLEEFKANKEMYMEKFACDEAGNPLAASTTPEPEPTPAPTPKETPEPEPKKTPAPEVTPPEPKKTTPKEKPAEGGLFHRIATGFFS